MATKRTKTKAQARARSRKGNVKLSNLPVAASGTVKGGDTNTKTSTTSTKPPQEFLKITMTDVLIS